METKSARCIATLFVIVFLMAGCSPNREKLIGEIEEFEASFTQLDCEMDTLSARKIIGLYTRFADAFPEDSLAPIYLFKASDVLQGICDYETSATYLDRVINNYEGFEGLPLCYFFLGRVYEQSEEWEAAAAAYEDFLERYPDHFLAADTRAILPLVKQGMDDEAQLEYLLAHTSDSLLTED